MKTLIYTCDVCKKKTLSKYDIYQNLFKKKENSKSKLPKYIDMCKPCYTKFKAYCKEKVTNN